MTELKAANLKSRLVECFATAFPDLSRQEIPSAAMASVASWDSLAVITLISLIEEEFHTSIPPDDVIDLISFELILEYLQRKQSDGTA